MFDENDARELTELEVNRSPPWLSGDGLSQYLFPLTVVVLCHFVSSEIEPVAACC